MMMIHKEPCNKIEGGGEEEEEAEVMILTREISLTFVVFFSCSNENYLK